MNTQQYLELLRSGIQMHFIDFTKMIDKEYEFSNITFENNGLLNSKEKNQGSAKVFCFGLMHSLSKDETLRCFGEHYQSVINSPENHSSHLNIRNFMKNGWEGILIDHKALKIKRKS